MGRAENLAAWRRAGGGRVGGLRRGDVVERGAAGKVVRAQWKGVKELQKGVKDLLQHMTGEQKMDGIRDIDARVMRPAAELVRSTWKERAQSSRWPSQVIESTFADTDMDKRQGRKRTALVGVKTGAPQGRAPSVRSASNPNGLYVTWGKRSGQQRGMSLARIFESGTRKFPARPALQPGLMQVGPRVLEVIGEGYKGVLADWRTRYVFADF